MRHALFLILPFLFFACSSSATKQYLDLPGDLRVVPGVITCQDGSVGYAALVADNTPYGGKLKLLDGCTGTVDEDFSDGTKGMGKGILIGSLIGAFDIMVTEGGIVVAAAVPDERRLALVHLDTSFDRLGDDVSVPLALVVRTVNRIEEFFVVMGSDFVAEQAFLVSVTGEAIPLTLEKRYDKIACDGEHCVARSSDDGAVYVVTVDRSGTVPSLSFMTDAIPDEVAALFPVSGVASVGEERFLVWNEETAVVFNAVKGEAIATIPFPFEGHLSTATAVSYIASRAYKSMSSEDAASYALIYVESSDEDTFVVEEETSDNDSEQEPSSDEETSVAAITLAAEAPDADIDADALDAQEAAAVWLSFDVGRALAYDLVSGGWMYAPVGEEESTLPILKDAGVTIPEEGETTEANRPRVTFVKAIRGLAVSLSYEFIYEALFSSSLGDAGEWRSSDSLFVDRFASFDRIITAEPSRYAVLLTEPPSGDQCLLPAGKTVSLEVRAVVDAHTLRVDAGMWGDEIASCYEGGMSYGIYPKGGYLVRIIGPVDLVREDIAAELPAYEGPITVRQVSYRDRYVELVIRRRTDDVVTSRGLSFAFTVAPSLSFFAPVTADIITQMEPTPNGHVLLVAPLRRSIYEYSPVFEETVTTYH